MKHDFASILKFIEVTFDLPSLGYGDLYADDMSDCFDFAQEFKPYEKVPSKFDAAYFLRQHEVWSPEDDDY